MAAPIQKGTDYHKTFGSKAYLKTFYTSPECIDEDGEALTPIFKEFHEIFNSTGRLKPESRLLDVGSGPTIHQLISASRFCTEIVCAEYIENNRTEIEKWVKKDPDMHDWAPFFKFVADLEGDSSSWEARQSHLRDAIKEVIPCDLTKPEPFPPLQYQFDVVTISFCLEVACPDRETYSAAVRNITRLLKPGGTLALAGVTNQTFYSFGGYKFFTLHIDSSFMREVFEKAGYVDINIKSFPATNPENNTVSDCDGLVVLHARKAEI
ncbi:nicotinamide N-methyltransferase-like [Branchiostoma floridae x Branchiostoma japonicum]